MNLKIVHILNNINGDREIQSIKNLSRLKNVGVEYIQQITPLYNGTAHNETKALTWTPTSPHNKNHYGNYITYKNAIKENFSEDLDALIICECDAYIELTDKEFLQEMENTLNFCNKYDIYHFSWGGFCQSFFHEDDEYPDYAMSDKIVLSHFNIFPKNSRNFYLSKIDNFGWDAADIWLNEMIFSGQELEEFELQSNFRKQALTKKKFSKQIQGKSYLDNIVKGENINNIKYANDIVAITTYCNNQTKIDVLEEQITYIRKNTTFKIAIHANYPLPIEIQKKVDHYFYENLNKTTPTIINVWMTIPDLGKKFTFWFHDNGYSTINQIKNSTNYLQNYDKILFINYDTILEKQHIIEHTLLEKDLLLMSPTTLLLFSANPKTFKNVDFSLDNYLGIKHKTTEEKFKLIVEGSNISIKYINSNVYDKITNMPHIVYDNKFVKNAIIHKNGNVLSIFLWDLSLKINFLKIEIDNFIFFVENQNKNNSFESTLEINKEIEDIKIIEINGEKTNIILKNTTNVKIEQL